MTARTGLTEHERSALLVPCECGHSINDHGSLIPCWTCAEDSEECGSDFEVLLLARVNTIVRARVLALLDETVRAALLAASRRDRDAGLSVTVDWPCPESIARDAVEAALRGEQL